MSHELDTANTPIFDVCAIGNAMVDVLSHESFELIEKLGLEPGAMNLVDAERADEIYEAMGPGTEVSGGSAANTTVGVVSFGGRSVVHRTDRRRHLRRDLPARPPHRGRALRRHRRARRLRADRPLPRDGDARRAAHDVHVPRRGTQPRPERRRPFDRRRVAGALPRGLPLGRAVGEARVPATPPTSRTTPDARSRSRSPTRSASNATAHFLDLVAGHVDILFANEPEICSLYEVDDFDGRSPAVQEHCSIAAVTRSEHGSVVVADGERHEVPAVPVTVVDTTGAGDLYAAGFLVGLTRGRSPSARELDRRSRRRRSSRTSAPARSARSPDPRRAGAERSTVDG